MKKKILVTGDRGYIGSTLVPLLIKNGYEVVGFDTEYFKENLGKQTINYKKLTKDIREISEKDINDIYGIIHLSALSNDPMGEINPSLTKEINFKSSVRLAKMAKSAGVKKFIFSSSCSIYGISDTGIVDETSKVNPLTAYAESKIESERELSKLGDKNFCVGILRNSTVYGYSPRFRSDIVVNNLVYNALVTGKLIVKSDGTPWRPLIDVRDLSNIFKEFLEADVKKINNEIINIGFDENNFRVRDLVDAIKKYLPQCEVVFTGEHGKDARSYRVNFSKFKEIFPLVSQEWTLDRSIIDLIKRLRKAKVNEIDPEIFTRLGILKSLIKENKLDENLYWRD